MKKAVAAVKGRAVVTPLGQAEMRELGSVVKWTVALWRVVKGRPGFAA